MQHIYVTSTACIRNKGSCPSYSFNDYYGPCYYAINQRIDKTLNPSSPCCASCFAVSVNRLPITANPSFIYGLRQSMLLGCSTYRRLIFSGFNAKPYCPIPVYGIDRENYWLCYSGKERNRRGRRERGRFCSSVSDGKRESEFCGVMSDAEAVLSLLTEDISEECYGVKESNVRSSEKKRMDKRRSGGSGRRKKNEGSGSLERIEFQEEYCGKEDERKSFSGNEDRVVRRGGSRFQSVAVELQEEHCRKEDERKLFERSENQAARRRGSGFESVSVEVHEEGRRKEDSRKFESSKNRVGGRGGSTFESVSAELREGHRKEVERKFEESDNRLLRGGESSCSSYYTLSSGEYESDMEAEFGDCAYVGETSSSHMESKRNRERFERAVEVDYINSSNNLVKHEEHEEDLNQRKVRVGSHMSGSSVQSEWRKESEKKLVGISIEEKDSTLESSKRHSRISGVQHGHSDSYKQFKGCEERSSLDMNRTDNRYSRMGQAIEGTESRIKHKQDAKMQKTHNSTVETTSSKNHDSDSEEIHNATVNLVHKRSGGHCKACGQFIREENLASSTSQEQFEARNTNLKESSTSVQTSIRESKAQDYRIEQSYTERANLERKSQLVAGTSSTLDSGTEKISTSQRQSRIRLKGQEDSSNSVSNLYQQAVKQQSVTNQEVPTKAVRRRGSQDIIDISKVQVTDSERGTSSQRVSKMTIDSQDINLTSVVKSTNDIKVIKDQTDEKLVRLGHVKESQRPIKQSSFHGKTSEGVSLSGTHLNLISEAEVPQITAGRDQTQSQPQPVGRVSLPAELDDRYTPEVDVGSSESGSNALGKRQQAGTSGSCHQHGQVRVDEAYWEPSNLPSHEDALGSADRLEKSSALVVGEFIEKVRHEILASETRKEKQSSDTESEGKSDYGMAKESSQRKSEGVLKEDNSRCSSGGSGAKGPSDEMWDVTDTSLKEPQPPKSEEPEGTSTNENAIVRRTSRSLWRIIFDSFRFRQHPGAESHGSAVNSHGKSSSNVSTSSEAWFSGHEPEESNNENGSKENQNIPQQPLSADQLQLVETPPGPADGSDSRKLKGKTMQSEIHASFPPDILESSLGSGSASFISGGINVGSAIYEKIGQGISSGTAVVESSLAHLAPRTIYGKIGQGISSGTAVVESSLEHLAQRASSIAEDISETSLAGTSSRGSLEQGEQAVSSSLTGVSSMEGKDAGLKRRKLQRINQVPTEIFEEWEEAYKHESEQRKIDEMFMREALLEAKKAADMWEVPVGAVLVQHGKIIARGSNLVEDLRDSTAHAEMICIREASKLLNSWRLVETTLYVTLEPCPMCAGAILQARIDTLVWGAPNKLLGADGSWVRLFRNGEGESELERASKPPGPVHPFHPKMTIRRGILESECADTMQQFFRLRRRKKDKKSDEESPPSCFPVSSHPPKILAKMHNIFNVMFC
ncbi:tRNA-specific adenosine deaminase, partial [Dillenia turbinata]